MRLGVVAVVCCLSIVGLSVADDARASIRKTTNIPSEGLVSALKQLAHERGFQLVFQSEIVGSAQTHGAVGTFTPDEALKELLKGTGLSYRYLDERTVTIIPVSLSTGGAGEAPSQASSAPATPTSNNTEDGLWSNFLVAQADRGASAGASSVERPNKISDGSVLEEVVVTAQKRQERLIDTPQSVSVLSSADLYKLGATQFRDFANTVPGLDFTTVGAGFTQIVLRGVTTGSDVSSTTAIYVDDVPYGSSSSFTGSELLTLDASLFDLDRIEVLRGPQGTLYGASSMGGLLKYVTRRPDLTDYSGMVQSGVSGTYNGGVNYNFAGMVNAPLVTDKVAVRASAFETHDGGYIDNLALDQQNVNRADIYGGRLDFLFVPVEGLTIRLGGFLQDISRDGEATSDYTFTGLPEYGVLEQFRKIAEPFDQHFRLGNGTVTYDFGPAMLTSVSSYQTLKTDLVRDASPLYLQYPFFADSFSAVARPQSLSTDKFTQEIRLASQKGERLEWLIGGFYTHETSGSTTGFSLLDLTGQPTANDLLTYSEPSTYKEYAGFGDLTWHLTRAFDVTGGIRYSRNDQTFAQYSSGLFAAPTPPRSSSQGVTTYLGDARYHFSDHSTGYLRYATGYRPGGPNYVGNSPITGLPLGPTSFESDSLKSYEAGYKATTADQRFGIDLAIYDIDWKNIQVSSIVDGFGVTINAPGGATIQGSELTLSARPSQFVTVTGAFAFQHAYLNDATPAVGGSAGERLPNVPRFTAALNADYQIAEGGLQPTLGASVRYVTDRWASFDGNTSYLQYRLPAYTAVDLRSGVVRGSSQLQLYVHNLFDEHAQLSANTWEGVARPTILQPRTIGITLTTHF